MGTVLFNFNTVDAIIAGLDWVEEELLIWVPDVIGSVCFLAASYLALTAWSGHGALTFSPWPVPFVFSLPVI